MKNIVFAGGTSLLAQCWIRDENPNYNFILGIHNRKPDHKNAKRMFLTMMTHLNFTLN